MEVLDWIERQPWSNGKVGLWGLSYEGTSAFFTSLLRHPTVVRGRERRRQENTGAYFTKRENNRLHIVLLFSCSAWAHSSVAY